MRKEAEKELIEAGIVSADDIQAAKSKSRNSTSSTLLTLLENRSAESSTQITEALAQHYKIPLLSLNKVIPPARMMKRCDPEVARKLHFLPIAEHGGQVVIGMVDPIDLNYGDEIRAIFQKSVQPVFISMGDFDRNYYRFFRKGVSLPDENSALMNTLILKKKFLESHTSDELSPEERETIARKFATSIVSKALANGASSFSIEPQQDVALIDITIDGSEYNLFRISISNHPALVDAMMRLAKIDPARHEGVDQFSRCQVKYRDQQYVLAYSFRQTPTGERVVVHIIDSKLNDLTIEDLGLTRKGLEQLRLSMELPGMMVVTGSSGSGKSTLLQVLTRHAVSLGKSIYTVEDIVGLKIEGARQFQMKPQGPPKANVLKAIQKKNPDVIVVDESDNNAIPAILDAVERGALVLLSITAPDISEAFARLLRADVSRSRLASALKNICTHKTIRKLCSECKTVARTYPQTRNHWQIPEQVSFTIGKGCEKCNGTGFHGTINLTELLPISENLSDLIIQGASGPEVVQAARHEGMLTLVEQGFNKAIDGATSLEEVIVAVPYQNPFSVKDQMRMGRVMPLPKEAISGHTAAAKQQHESPFLPALKQGSPVAGHTHDSVDFDELPPSTEKKPEIIKEEEKPSSPSPASTPAETVPTTAESADANDKANILLVDDSPVTLEFTRHILDVSGHFSVDVCDTAKGALNMLQEKQYHLVITDQEMPEQTGQEFIESIRQHPSLNSVGTILLTGNLNEMSALEGGADGYIAKPTDPELLVARAKSISDIYKRLSGIQSPREAAPLATQIPSPNSMTPGKIEFTESDLAKVSAFELDMPGASKADAREPVTDEPDSSGFDELFK
ncbi:MAG TPA: ATPase, T2SS/T4P/T4SS family [Mariprofundaceae bacterium]|nr:ATPase, T2SS/T4P/T4SS family [Mariprofundaceae bacterium]